MGGLLRRVRGAVGMGLTWGAAWFVAGMGLLLVVGPDAADVPFPLGFGFLGFLAGCTFSVVLALTEGHCGFQRMSLPRFTGWGAVGGLLLSVVFVLLALRGDVWGGLAVLCPVFTLAGAVSAAGTLALARMADGGDKLDAPAPERGRLR